MPSCEQMREYLSARLDGELTPAQEAELEAHLASCGRCRALAERMNLLEEVLRDLEDDLAPGGFTERVMGEIREQRTGTAKKKTKRKQFRRIFTAMAGLAACLAVCVAVWKAGIPMGARLENPAGGGTSSTAGDLSVVDPGAATAPLRGGASADDTGPDGSPADSTSASASGSSEAGLVGTRPGSSGTRPSAPSGKSGNAPSSGAQSPSSSPAPGGNGLTEDPGSSTSSDSPIPYGGGTSSATAPISGETVVSGEDPQLPGEEPRNQEPEGGEEPGTGDTIPEPGGSSSSSSSEEPPPPDNGATGAESSGGGDVGITQPTVSVPVGIGIPGGEEDPGGDASSSASGEEPEETAHAAVCSAARSVPVSWNDSLSAPSARILGSPSSLSAFLGEFGTDLSSLRGEYSAEYFHTKSLIAIVLTSSSGSGSYTLPEQDVSDGTVYVVPGGSGADGGEETACVLVSEVSLPLADGTSLLIQVRS